MYGKFYAVSSSDEIQIGTIEAKLTWLMTPIGLLIDEANLTGGPVTIDTDELRNSTGEMDFEAIIRNQSVAVFLEKLQPGGLHNISVQIRPDGVHIQALKTVLLPIQVSAHAKLKLDSPDSISVELIAAEAMGAGLKNMVANQIEQINPIVESDMFPIPVRFEKVIHEEGQVRVTGKGKLSAN